MDDRFERERRDEMPEEGRTPEAGMQARPEEERAPEAGMQARPEEERAPEAGMQARPEREGHTTSQPGAGQRQEHFYQERIKPRKESGMFRKVLAALLVVSIAGGGSLGAGFALTQNLLLQRSAGKAAVSGQEDGSQKQDTIQGYTQDNNTLSMVSSSQDESSNKAVQIIKDVYPSVVSINTTVRGATEYFSGFVVPYEGEGAGSGVIFAEDEEKAYIVTNYHVVDSAVNITISVNGTENIPAKVVSTDNTSELAVISVTKADLQAAGIDKVKVAEFGDSDKLEIGESVIAIGNALGQGKTATGGMISAIGKEINVDGKTLNVIQLDAAINPGNSGGALVNYDGEVVGINTAKSGAQASEGMGYAIPSNAIKPVMERLMEEGINGKPYLGIVGENVTDDLSEIYGLPVGVLVRQIVEGGSAAEAGIEPGDIITDFGDEKIMEMSDLTEALANQKVGDTVEIRVIRDGKTPMILKAVIQDANNQ